MNTRYAVLILEGHNLGAPRRVLRHVPTLTDARLLLVECMGVIGPDVTHVTWFGHDRIEYRHNGCPRAIAIDGPHSLEDPS